MGDLHTQVKWRWLRALQVWNRAPIRAQGGIIALIPIVAVLVSFGFAIYGNLSRAERQEDIERKFTATRQYGDLLALMIDAETGERGYLLTHRPEFLEPYKKAVSDIPATIDSLESTILTEPGEKPRQERLDGLANIRALIGTQLAHLLASQSFPAETIGSPQLYEHLAAGKSTMDRIRSSISEMQNKEQGLLADRLAEIDSIRVRDYTIIFITLFIGLAVRAVSFYLFDRGIVRRIDRIADYIDGLARGVEGKFTPSQKKDALGNLEEKLNDLSVSIKAGRLGNDAATDRTSSLV